MSGSQEDFLQILNFGSVKRCPIALHREREEFMLYLVEAHPTAETKAE
jgi:hypothetical protein